LGAAFALAFALVSVVFLVAIWVSIETHA
jgi:Flp pilus assembly protein TadG